MPNTINIGTTQALEFKLVGDHSSSTLSFSLYESSGGSALFTKSGTNITKIYNAPYTFIQVAILKGDTSGLTGGYKDYTISGTSGVLESGSIYCSPVTHNATDPLSQFDRLTTRIIALEADEFDDGDFLRVAETDGVKSFVNLTPAEVRTALEVAKIEGGSSTELYLKWNNSTSKWETRTLAEIQGDLGITPAATWTAFTPVSESATYIINVPAASLLRVDIIVLGGTELNYYSLVFPLNSFLPASKTFTGIAPYTIDDVSFEGADIIFTAPENCEVRHRIITELA